jgi:predicted SnoaL-like aldol condensation-catalyzing enzyme
LAHLFARLSKTNPKVDIVRLFEDGDYVFGHTIYDFASVRIGFEVFRFEGEQVVEHWDNIQPRVGAMVDGTKESSDQNLTEENRQLIKSFINEVFLVKNITKFSEFISNDNYIEHSTLMNFSKKVEKVDSKHTHRLLAEGDFVLAENEGINDSVTLHSMTFLELNQGQIVEHWDTRELVPDKRVWKNDNGKF